MIKGDSFPSETSKRLFIKQALSGGVALCSTGCVTVGRNTQPSPSVFSEKDGIYIDAHAHVFNVLDLDTENFIFKFLDRYTARYSGEVPDAIREALKKVISLGLKAADRLAAKHASYDREDAYLDQLISARAAKLVSLPFNEVDQEKRFDDLSKAMFESELTGQQITRKNYQQEFEDELSALLNEEVRFDSSKRVGLNDNSSGIEDILILKEFDSNGKSLVNEIRVYSAKLAKEPGLVAGPAPVLRKIVGGIITILKIMN